MYQLNCIINDKEYWYGLCVNDGIKCPIDKNSTYSIDLDPNPTNNQASPFFVSNQGRYIWSEQGFQITIEDGMITCSSKKAPIELFEGYASLREAYLAGAKKHFPSNDKIPPERFFTRPQYNTWIELIYDQNQKHILQYARNIISEGMPPGILMIDDGWNDYYGHWDFSCARFTDAKAMIKDLHDMDFQVMVWTCPFISPDTKEFRELAKKGYLVKDHSLEPAIKKWWNGYSAVLDFSNPDAQNWYYEQNKYLQTTYGVDGFKFDAGDGTFYSDDDVTFGKVTANEQTELWLKHGLNYPYNEFRAAFKCAGLPLVHRLADKNHSWEKNGVASLIPNQLLQGILGYAYTCPDMIGGGEYENFLENSQKLDQELFVRYAQCAALMPMMQFSAAPWRVLTKENAQICKEAAGIHEKYSDYIYQLAMESKKTCEPIVRYMEYAYPHQGFEWITDQFMLGDRILAAPVWKKGEVVREVMLPKGRWKYVDGQLYDGGEIVRVAAPLNCLPYFEKI